MARKTSSRGKCDGAPAMGPMAISDGPLGYLKTDHNRSHHEPFPQDSGLLILYGFICVFLDALDPCRASIGILPVVANLQNGAVGVLLTSWIPDVVMSPTKCKSGAELQPISAPVF